MARRKRNTVSNDGKQKQVASQRLSDLDGVKDVSYGPASTLARRRGDFSKTGPSEDNPEPPFADMEGILGAGFELFTTR